MLSDVAQRQLRYRCKAGNESYPKPLTACTCDVRLLNYAWKKRWLADRQLAVVISSQSATVAVQRSSQSFWCCLVTLRFCGVGTRPAVDHDPKTRLRNAITPARCPPVLFKALVGLLNVPRAAVTESSTQLAVVDQRSCGQDAPPKWNLPMTTRLQQVDARSGDEKLFTSHFLMDAKPLLSMQYQWADSKLPLDSCSGHGGLASKIDDASVQLRFVRVTSCHWFHPLS